MFFRRIILFFVASVALCAVSNAEEPSYLHIRTSSGWEVLNLDRVERLTFANNTMTATDASNAVVATFPQSALEVMHVNDSAGIGSVEADSSNEAFAFDGASGSVVMLADGDFEVYSLNGSRLVFIPAVKKGEVINLSNIEPGTVVVKSGNNALKVVVK